MLKKLVGFGTLALLCSQVKAQEEEKKDTVLVQQLDEVVVSDSRFALKRENSGKTVVRITSEELNRNLGRSVAEIINTKSGLEVNGSRSYAGQNVSVYARGGNNRQVLVVIDGIQVNDPSNVNGEYDLRLLDAAQIKSIEILKGAASTLYGNSAATAVINITTKGAQKKGLALQVGSTLGTNSEQDRRNNNISQFSNTFQLTEATEKVSVSVLGGHKYTNGLSALQGTEPDVVSRYNGQLKLGYAPTQKLSFTGAVFYNKLDSGFDNSFPLEDADFRYDGEESRFAVSALYDYGAGQFQINSAFNQIDRRIISNFPASFTSESLLLDVFNRYVFNGTWYTVLGVNIMEGRTLFTETVENTTIDPYMNVVYVGKKGINLNIGARLNNHNAYGSHFIYNLNPSFRVKTKEGYLKFFGSYGTSFIAPNLSQLFGPFGANPLLGPETNNTAEVGWEYRPSARFRLSALYYQRTEEDRILFTTINPDTFESTYRNSTVAITFNGVEVECAVWPMETLFVSANYTFTDSDSGLALRVPKHRANLLATYELSKRTSVQFTFQYVSEREDTDFGTFEDVSLSAYDLMDLHWQYTLNDRFSFFLTAENIFNAKYEEVLGFNTRGRNFRGGFRLALN
jgi:vitamin B12 transporter